MKIQDIENQEYQTRSYIFMCRATSEFPPDEYYRICKFEGTKQQLDNKLQIIKSIDKDFEYIIEKTYNNITEWAKVYRKKEDVNLRRSFNSSHYKEGSMRKESYRYLKGRF